MEKEKAQISNKNVEKQRLFVAYKGKCRKLRRNFKETKK